jgi:hypothetical protein
MDKEMNMTKVIEIVGSIAFFTSLFGACWFVLVVTG